MTPDKKQTTHELELVMNDANPLKECPPVSCDVSYSLLCDVLALLKEQGEPQKAVRKQCKRQRYDGAVEYYAEWYCPHCDSLLKQGYSAPWIKYCFNCGNPVEWEGR